jgi:hypothetical protein
MTTLNDANHNYVEDETTNICFLIDEVEQEKNDIINEENKFSIFLSNDGENDSNHAITEMDSVFSQMVYYNINYTIKELFVICDYYGITKNIKNLKLNKEQIIEAILFFENNLKNTKIVFRRKQMWRYINELKKDKFMKKFILF